MPHSPPCTTFGLMRHAPTQWNLIKRIQGIGDSQLTDEGERRAGQWGRRLASLGYDRILASDLGRTQKTARLLNTTLRLPMTTTDKLREMDWGEWTGLTLQHLKSEKRAVLAEMISAGWDFQPPGGESRRTVRQRVELALQEAAATWPDQNILVVTHGGVLKAVIYGLSQREYLPSEPPLLLPGHLHRLNVADGTLRLEAVNALDLNGGEDLVPGTIEF
jgi:broad specificity phosphatase PhoE